MILSTDKSTSILKIKSITSSSDQFNITKLKRKYSIHKNSTVKVSSPIPKIQWIYFDLRSKRLFNLLTILWETNYGRGYKIQISDDALKWKTIFNKENCNGDKDIIPIGNRKARYIRMYDIIKKMDLSYSILDFKVEFIESNTPPSPPYRLSILTGNNVLALNWSVDKEQELYGYNIYRSTSIKEKYKRINKKIIKKPGYVDTSLSNGKRYYYYIEAIDYLLKKSRSSEKKWGIPAPVIPVNSYLDSSLPIKKRVDDLLSRMSLKEKIEQLSGVPEYDDLTTYKNDRLGIPPLKCADGPHGVRYEKGTAFPVSLAISSTWNPELMKRIGIAIAKELKVKGRNQSLGPCVNICKDPRGGRTFEGYGEDPYLTSRMAVAAVKGIQSQRVIATPKHYICNNKENNRDTGSVKIDEKSLREIYLPGFKACITEGGALSIMGAYNKVNGIYCCENKYLLKKILKDEWNFQGFVVSDWFACHCTLDSITAGLDLEMPFDIYYGQNLEKAVKKRHLSERIVNDSVRRILYVKFQFGLFDTQLSKRSNIVECKEHIKLALDAARESIILLKNEDNILPLQKDKIKTIAVLGPSADKTTCGVDLGSSQVDSSYYVTPLQGIKKKTGRSIRIVNDPKQADVVIIFVGLSADIAGRQEGEGIDRLNLHLPGDQDKLIKHVALLNKKTIVVLLSGSAVSMKLWDKRVPGIIQSFYPGLQGGNAIADVIFGDYNPSGKLPITFPESIHQLPEFTWNYIGDAKRGVGYQYYDRQNIKPLFPFGHGLSYTTFQYNKLKIKPKNSKDGNIKIDFTIKNTGMRKGDEVVQLYVQKIRTTRDKRAGELKKFLRITVKPGKIKTVNFQLKPEDLVTYNKNKKYVLHSGTYRVLVGSSSRDIRLIDNFKIHHVVRLYKKAVSFNQ